MLPAYLSRKEVRDVDRRALEEYGLPGIVLMENAARGCVDWLCELVPASEMRPRIVICAGKGNNGGDGFAMARHLANRGYAVRVLLFAQEDQLVGDAAINWNVLKVSNADLKLFSEAPDRKELQRELDQADWIVDALLGTGTQGTLREPYLTVIKVINQSQRPIMVIDLPSGLDCDLGTPIHSDDDACVRATVTATFVARKLGFENPLSKIYTGEVRVIDIGVPHHLLSGAASMVRQS